MSIRRGTPADLPQIAAIQSACPEAAHWCPSEYLTHDLRVFEFSNQIAGFLVSRAVASTECEVLNLAVAPEFRRRGIARQLVESLQADFSGEIFLEVRESNAAARQLYQALGFREIGSRPAYYESPPEPAVVMKFHSC